MYSPRKRDNSKWGLALSLYFAIWRYRVRLDGELGLPPGIIKSLDHLELMDVMEHLELAIVVSDVQGEGPRAEIIPQSDERLWGPSGC